MTFDFFFLYHVLNKFDLIESFILNTIMLSSHRYVKRLTTSMLTDWSIERNKSYYNSFESEVLVDRMSLSG
jgi:hypothetical protein